MKRLEHIPTLRNQTSPFRAKTPAAAMMAAGQIRNERQRLEQERENWQGRIKSIDARLKEIARMEHQLLVVAGVKRGKCRGAREGPRSLPPGFTEFTMRY
ncbi:MAG: hypothetical protein AAB225_08770 [Acidobacteriota bacterium]